MEIFFLSKNTLQCLYHNLSFRSNCMCSRAYERGLQEVHRTRAREVLGLGKMKVRRLSFSVIKPKITSVQGSCQYLIQYNFKSWHGSCLSVF